MSRLNTHSMVVHGLALTSFVSASWAPYPCWAAPATPPAAATISAPQAPPTSATPSTSTATQPGDQPNTADSNLLKMTPKMDDSHPAATAQSPAATSSQSEADMMKEAVRLTQTHNWDEATKLFQEVIGKDPNNADAYYDLGAIAENQGDFKEALNWYEAAHGLRPKDRSIKEAIAALQKTPGVVALAQEGALGSAPAVPTDSMVPDNPDLAGFKKIMKTEHHRQIRRKIIVVLVTAAVVALVVAACCS